jgi:hypothetical protein
VAAHRGQKSPEIVHSPGGYFLPGGGVCNSLRTSKITKAPGARISGGLGSALGARIVHNSPGRGSRVAGQEAVVGGSVGRWPGGGGRWVAGRWPGRQAASRQPQAAGRQAASRQPQAAGRQGDGRRPPNRPGSPRYRVKIKGLRLKAHASRERRAGSLYGG